jgi:hypothetical protein
MPSKNRGGLSKREWKAKQKGEEMPYRRKMQRKALEKVYQSGFDSKGKRIDFSSKKTPRGIITSID